MITNSKDIERTVIVEEVVVGSVRYLAKAGTLLSDTNGNTRDIIGFSFSEDRDTSLRLATYEMYERFWAVYPIACGISPQVCIECTHHESKSLQEVLIGDLLPSFGSHATNIDSTGFAYRDSFEGAYEHGLMEVCERHLLEKVWYSNESLVHISSSKVKELSGVLSSYLIEGCVIPFVTSFFIADDCSLMSAGSSVKHSFDGAKNKAEKEALMIALSQKKGLTPAYLKAKHIKKYNEIPREVVEGQIRHIRKKIDNRPISQKDWSHIWSVKDIATAIFGENVDPLVCNIHEGEGEVVIRVLINTAKNPRNSRGSSKFPIDPFN